MQFKDVMLLAVGIVMGGTATGAFVHEYDAVGRYAVVATLQTQLDDARRTIEQHNAALTDARKSIDAQRAELARYKLGVTQLQQQNSNGWNEAMRETVALNDCKMAAIRLQQEQQTGQLSPGGQAALSLLKALLK